LKILIQTSNGDLTAKISNEGKTAVVILKPSSEGSDRVLRDRAFLHQPDRYQANLSDTLTEPKTYQKAMNCNNCKEWMKAMDEEISSHKQNSTWCIVE